MRSLICSICSGAMWGLGRLKISSTISSTSSSIWIGASINGFVTSDWHHRSTHLLSWQWCHLYAKRVFHFVTSKIILLITPKLLYTNQIENKQGEEKWFELVVRHLVNMVLLFRENIKTFWICQCLSCGWTGYVLSLFTQREGCAELVDRVPDNFRFILKVHQSVTTQGDLPEGMSMAEALTAFKQAIQPMVDAGRLYCLLAQFPNRFEVYERKCGVFRWSTSVVCSVSGGESVAGQ